MRRCGRWSRSRPPSLPEHGWHGERRLLVLYGLLLATSALFALLIGLKVARQSELDAFISGLSALMVLAFSFHEWRVLAPLLDLRNMRFKGALSIALGVVLTVAVLQAYFLVLGSLGIPTYRSWPSFEQDGWPLWSAFLLVAVMPGVFEELAFRGLIYEGLGRVMSRRDALLVQAMAFSVLHLSPWIFVRPFLDGPQLGACCATAPGACIGHVGSRLLERLDHRGRSRITLARRFFDRLPGAAGDGSCRTSFAAGS